MKELYSFEEAAELATASGWVCKTCKRFYGDKPGDERVARYCCAKDMPCECGARVDKNRIRCPTCQGAFELEAFSKLKRAEWNGEPLCADYDDYYFDECEIADWIVDHYELESEKDITLEHIEGMRLRICDPTDPPEFDMNEFLCDHLPEDCVLQSADIEQVVNDWIKANGPKTYYPGDIVPTSESVLAAIKGR